MLRPAESPRMRTPSDPRARAHPVVQLDVDPFRPLLPGGVRRPLAQDVLGAGPPHPARFPPRGRFMLRGESGYLPGPRPRGGAVMPSKSANVKNEKQYEALKDKG